MYAREMLEFNRNNLIDLELLKKLPRLNKDRNFIFFLEK